MHRQHHFSHSTTQFFLIISAGCQTKYFISIALCRQDSLQFTARCIKFNYKCNSQASRQYKVVADFNCASVFIYNSILIWSRRLRG